MTESAPLWLAPTRMHLTRLPDWPARLVAYLQQQQEQAFAWGLRDCCTFAAGAVHALTGCDLLQVRWSGQAEAVLVLRAEGGLAGAATRRLGPPLPTPRLAQRGDIVLVRHQLGERRALFLAVCDSDRWVAPHPTGLVRGPMAQARKGWRV